MSDAAGPVNLDELLDALWVAVLESGTLRAVSVKLEEGSRAAFDRNARPVLEVWTAHVYHRALEAGARLRGELG